MPQIFRSKPRIAAKTIKPQELSPTERGYNSKWRRYSERFRKGSPFCARCLEDGRLTLIVLGKTGVVDHKWPVRLGGPMWDKRNHWGLCNGHHSGWKALLEAYAEESGHVNDLILWCDDPAKRPKLRGDVSCAEPVSLKPESTS